MDDFFHIGDLIYIPYSEGDQWWLVINETEHDHVEDMRRATIFCLSFNAVLQNSFSFNYMTVSEYLDAREHLKAYRDGIQISKNPLRSNPGLLQRRSLTRFSNDSIPSYVLVLNIHNHMNNGVETQAYTVSWLDTWHGIDAAVYDWVEKYYTLFSTLDT